MKRFFKALLFTCLCVIAIVCGCYVLYLWFQFTSKLNVGFWMQLLIYLSPSIILIVASIFLEIYNQLSRETNSDKKELISDWDEAHEIGDPKIFFEQLVQASRPSKSKMIFVCPPGLEAEAIEYFKDTNIEIVFLDPIKAKEFYDRTKEILEDKKR